PLKKAKNGVHLNLGGHHRLNRWHQEDVLLGRLLFKRNLARSRVLMAAYSNQSANLEQSSRTIFAYGLITCLTTSSQCFSQA
ncbi:hypothetical protein, partial [Pseudomonas sp. CFBP13509]|uniref:hypothetical protein n=1 Tax=Pseudomonas sp. CFBP13509 TaxID=2184008 RepID=UPI001A7EB139